MIETRILLLVCLTTEPTEPNIQFLIYIYIYIYTYIYCQVYIIYIYIYMCEQRLTLAPIAIKRLLTVAGDQVSSDVYAAISVS